MRSTPAPTDRDFVEGVRVAEFDSLPSGRYWTRVSLVAATGVVLARRVTAVQLDGSYALTSVLSRRCGGVTCPRPFEDPSLTTCNGGVCVDPGCAPGRVDLCADPECTMDSDCTAMGACGRAACEGNVCLAAPDDGRCGSSERCTPAFVCEVVPPDAGAAVDAGAVLDAGPAPDLCAGNSCSGRGWCEGGLCLCDVGYAGDACERCDGIWQTATEAPIFCLPTMTSLDGTDGDDAMLDGTTGNDHVRGLFGNDMVRGLAGSDYVNGNGGMDSVNGNEGRDEVLGGIDDDTVMGGMDDDVLKGNLGNDVLLGGFGNDRLIGDDGDDVLRGEAGDDRYMIDGLGMDTLDDGDGNNSARCVPGIRIVSESMEGADRVLVLSSGGRVTIVGDRVRNILGCR